jgi:hypothetical protein
MTMDLARTEAVRQYQHLDFTIEHSSLDIQDKSMVLQEDRQGLDLSPKRSEEPR